MKCPTLYHKTKLGKIVEWNCWTVGPKVYVEWGEIDGKKQTTFTVATPKNVGKKNEVNAEKQARLEAVAMHKHRLERKYSLTKEEASLPVFLPMLAHDFEKCKAKVVYPVHVQPKLDGNRALAYWEEDKIVLMSRGGKTWNIPHIEEAVAKFLPKNMVLDGEVYKHGLNLQGINKLIKKFRPGPDGTESLQFWVFDCFDPEEENTWNERKFSLDQLFVKESDDMLIPVLSVIAKTDVEVKNLAQRFIEEGYEGAIIRKLDGKYALGQRSRDLLKLKNFQDDEFLIVDTYMGEGKHDGCIGFVCETKDKQVFRCYPRGTLEQRREWGTRSEDFINKKLKVRFHYYSDDKIPQLPIGIAIRDERDI